MTRSVSTAQDSGGEKHVLKAPSSAAFLFFGLVAVVLILYWPTVAQIVGRWDSAGGYSHGWLILGLVSWIIWARYRVLFATVSGPRWPAFVLAVAAVATSLAGQLIFVQVIEQLSLLALILLIPMMLFGWRGGMALTGALSLLAFTVPMWEIAIPPLQHMTVRAVDICLDLSRVPAYIVGNVVTIPSGQFRIVQGCSGMHFFVSGFTLASVYAYLYLHLWRHRILLVIVTLAAAILANWLRVYLVILSGYLTDMQHFLVQVDHYYFGWLMFGISLIPVFVLAMRMERSEQRAGLGGRIEPHGNTTLAGAGVIMRCAFAVLVFLAGPLMGHVIASERAAETWCPRALPDATGWDTGSLARHRWRPDFSGQTLTLGNTYHRDDDEVITWLVFYSRQGQGRELIYYSNRPFDDEKWQETERTVTTGKNGVSMISLVLVDRNGQKRRLSYWYEVGGRPTISRSAAVLLQIPSLLAGRRDAAFISFSAACDATCADADAAIGQILSAFGPEATRLSGLQNCGEES